MGAEFFGARLLARLEHHAGERSFAPFLVWDRDYRGFLHSRVGHQFVFHVHRADPFATGLDQVLGTVGDANVAVAIDRGDVAGGNERSADTQASRSEAAANIAAARVEIEDFLEPEDQACRDKVDIAFAYRTLVADVQKTFPFDA